uniref:Uncharacterized protein n=1 Tax=Anguilla anguilla TaxID=7936 RepID=A0A0E9SIY0_ANGAN
MIIYTQCRGFHFHIHVTSQPTRLILPCKPMQRNSVPLNSSGVLNMPYTLKKRRNKH